MKRLYIFLCMALLLTLPACSLITSSEGSAPTARVEEIPPVSTTQPAQPTPQPAADLGGEQFDQALAQAFAGRDFAAIRALMGERFSILFWNSELRVIAADEAVEWLKQGDLVVGSQPVANFVTDVPVLLGGTDPLEHWGPVADVVSAFHVTGLGPNASDEAILAVSKENASGNLYFHGMIVVQGGSFAAFSQYTGPVFDSDAQQVTALQELVVRSGPGDEYMDMGRIRGGEVAQVSGVTEDALWYRIFCTQSLTGHCWISADPGFVEVVPAP